MWGSVDTSNDARCRELRRCAKCGANALTVVHVTQHYSRGLPSGRTYRHRCGGCAVELDSVSWWRAIVELAFAGILACVGFGMLFATIMRIVNFGVAFALHSGGDWGMGAGGALFFFGGLAWGAWTTWLVTRLVFLHPVVGGR